MNRSAKDGAWSSPHYGDEGAWVPLRRTKVCADDTVGKSVSDSGRPGIVRRQGMAGIVRHSQTKGRATGNAKPSLKPANGRCGYKRKRNSGRSGARGRIGARYSRTGSEQKVPDRHHRAATLVGSKRPTGGGRPRTVWRRQVMKPWLASARWSRQPSNSLARTNWWVRTTSRISGAPHPASGYVHSTARRSDPSS